MNCEKFFTMLRILINNKNWYTLKELINNNNNTIEIKIILNEKQNTNFLKFFSKMSKLMDMKYFEMFRNLQFLIITISKLNQIIWEVRKINNI